MANFSFANLKIEKQDNMVLKILSEQCLNWFNIVWLTCSLLCVVLKVDGSGDTTEPHPSAVAGTKW